METKGVIFLKLRYKFVSRSDTLSHFVILVELFSPHLSAGSDVFPD